jgi:hypothetical protein
MLRACSMLGLGGGFLMISPSLRGSITESLGKFTLQMELYSPWSYIGGGVLVLLALATSLCRGARPQ